MMGKIIGIGAYGEVYELKNSDRVIKIFKDSIDMKKDLKRYTVNST